MNKKSYSVLFYIKRTKLLKDGKAPIFTRITVDHERVEFTLQRKVEESLWDDKSSRMLGNTIEAIELNDYLDNVQSKLYEIKRNYEEFHKPFTSIDIKNEFFGIKNEDSFTFFEIFQEHNDRVKALIGKDYVKDTHKHYQTTLNNLKSFVKWKYNKSDLQLEELNSKLILDFELFLKQNKNCCNNTAIKYMKHFRKIIRIALNRGLKKDPFLDVKFKLDKVEIDYLEDFELETLLKKKFENSRIQNVKNIYLFCCFTGLAFTDVYHLTPENLVTDGKGNKWIYKKRQKTGTLCKIPLLPPAEEILNYYQEFQSFFKGHLLPVLSNQKMNVYLKEIADSCQINKKLTTHTARHTFATTVTLANDVPLEVVSKILGHSSIKMTLNYARVLTNNIEKSMNPLKEKYPKQNNFNFYKMEDN